MLVFGVDIPLVEVLLVLLVVLVIVLLEVIILLFIANSTLKRSRLVGHLSGKPHVVAKPPLPPHKRQKEKKK
jgi:hypothetical protein